MMVIQFIKFLNSKPDEVRVAVGWAEFEVVAFAVAGWNVSLAEFPVLDEVQKQGFTGIWALGASTHPLGRGHVLLAMFSFFPASP